MRFAVTTLLVIAFVTCAAAEKPQRYIGVVRRLPDGRPVAGLRVTANVDPAPSPIFWIPRTYQEIGRTRTARDGTFSFTLTAPQRRLWFMAWGQPEVTRDGPSHETVRLTDRVLRRPRADQLNVIEVPAGFRPWTRAPFQH